MYILATSISLSLIVICLVIYVLFEKDKITKKAIADQQIENTRLRDVLLKKKRDGVEAAHRLKVLEEEERRQIALNRKAELEEERIAKEKGPKYYVATYFTTDGDTIRGSWTDNLDAIEREKQSFKSKSYIEVYKDTHTLSQEFVNQLAIDNYMSIAAVLDQTPLPH